MKFGELKSIGHNIADSLASGICLLVGYFEIDIFEEAETSSDGFILVDFLAGTVSGAKGSAKLAKVVHLYKDALVKLCERHGVAPENFKRLTVKYAVDRVYGRYFNVEVQDSKGRISIDPYLGVPGRKVKFVPS